VQGSTVGANKKRVVLGAAGQGGDADCLSGRGQVVVGQEVAHTAKGGAQPLQRCRVGAGQALAFNLRHARRQLANRREVGRVVDALHGETLELGDHAFHHHARQHHARALSFAHALHREVEPGDEAVDARQAGVEVHHRAVRRDAFARRNQGEEQMPAVHLVELQQRPDRRGGRRMPFQLYAPRPGEGVVGDAVRRRQPRARDLPQLRQVRSAST
jgi:hypothetical protein